MATRRQFLMAAAAVPAMGARLADAEPVRVAALPAKGGIQPQIAMADGVLHLIYFDGDAKSGNVFYTRSHDFGKRFSTPIAANSQTGTAMAIGAIRGAQIAIGGAKKVHVAWHAADGKAMYYTQLNDKGTAFEPQKNVTEQTFGLDGASVAADRSGNVYVAWHSPLPGTKEGEAGRRVWLVSSHDAGRTFEKERAVSNEANGACGCCGLRIFSDSRGEVYGLYRTATANVHRDIHILQSKDKGASFTDRLVQKWEINACPMSSMDFIETSGGVVGAWETQTQVYYAPVARMGEVAIAPPGDRPRRKYPVLARNSKGETLLAWVEGSGWQKSGVLGWQIFDAAGKPLAACKDRRDVPVWSFPAVFARPDDGFTILV